MKLHTALTETEIRDCLARAQEAGEVPADVAFDLFSPAGSRSHRGAWEVHLATARNDTRDDERKRPAAAYSGGSGLRYAASYDEWGWFLAEFFRADPGAKVGPYKGQAGFHARTEGAYSDGHEDYSEDEDDAEPYQDEPDTEPVTDAMLSYQAIEEEFSGCWANPAHP